MKVEGRVSDSERSEKTNEKAGHFKVQKNRPPDGRYTSVRTPTKNRCGITSEINRLDNYFFKYSV